MKKILLLTFGFAVSVVFLFFAMVNREVVTLDLTPTPYVIEMRLFVFMGLLLLFGTVLGWVVASFECRRRYLVQKDTRRRLQALNEEVASLRAQLQHHQQAHAPLPPADMTQAIP